MMSETVDTRGAAELLHVSEKTAAKLAREGELPAVWLAGSWLFLKSDIISWLMDRAREEQRFRKEQIQAAVQIQGPRSVGRPRKIQVVN